MSVWVVLNPSKVRDSAAFQAQVCAAAACVGVTGIHWVMTSPEETGGAQAREALSGGASLVIAAGGDGTVCAVAAELARAKARGEVSALLGIIPVGTGNVLARNLGLPLRSVAAATRVACGAAGRIVPVDVAWLRAGEAPDVEYPFITLAGAGFDGATMAATSAQLKKRIGWFAYVVGAWKSRTIAPFTVDLRFFDEPGGVGGVRHVSSVVKSVVVSNIGRLPLLFLAPAARWDDGAVDVTLVNTRAGLFGWFVLGLRLAAQYLRPYASSRTISGEWSPAKPAKGVHTSGALSPVFSESPPVLSPVTRRSFATVEYAQAPRVRVELSQPCMVEIDGDPLMVTTAFDVRAQRHAISVCAP